ncbi:MAG: S8 family serine peptidase [Bdellovibrionota bacterium]
MKLIFRLLVIAIAAVSANSVYAGVLPIEKEYEFALWNLHNYGQPFRIDSETLGKHGLKGADIKILDAWKIQRVAPDVLVAVIDGDFDLDHPDLEGVFEKEKAYDFLRNQKGVGAPNPAAVADHGTMVSGVIGANGLNAIGITGVAQQVKILPLEAIPEEGDEKDEIVASAILYAVNQGARVINCSFGKYSTSEKVAAALKYAGEKNVLVVAGSGNDHENIDKSLFWPASYSAAFANLISVAATNRRDELWPNSNFGLSVDIAAPGHEIFTTGATRARLPYMSFSGTSAATPHVSAVAALMIAHYPGIKAGEIKQILLESVDKIPALYKKVKSGGRLNAAKALQLTDSLVQAQLSGLASSCDFEKNKRIIRKKKNGYTALWEMKRSAELSAPYSGSEPNYSNYVKWVKSKTQWTAKEILQNHLAVAKKAIEGMDPKDSFVVGMKKDNAEVEQIINGEIGRFHAMNCLESVPFREFLKVVDLRKYSQELNATVLQKNGELKIIGDFYLVPTPEGGAAGTGESDSALALRHKLLREGWTYLAHYHNHPFAFDNPYGDIGGNTAPSEADVAHYLEDKPELALISNGLESIELSREDYSKLK